jgi:hypothetical protein
MILAESIGLGLGNPNCVSVDDINMVMQEAESGGAEDVIKRQNGVHTIIYPVNTARGAPQA